MDHLIILCEWMCGSHSMIAYLAIAITPDLAQRFAIGKEFTLTRLLRRAPNNHRAMTSWTQI